MSFIKKQLNPSKLAHQVRNNFGPFEKGHEILPTSKTLDISARKLYTFIVRSNGAVGVGSQRRNLFKKE